MLQDYSCGASYTPCSGELGGCQKLGWCWVIQHGMYVYGVTYVFNLVDAEYAFVRLDSYFVLRKALKLFIQYLDKLLFSPSVYNHRLLVYSSQMIYINPARATDASIH